MRSGPPLPKKAPLSDELQLRFNSLDAELADVRRPNSQLVTQVQELKTVIKEFVCHLNNRIFHFYFGYNYKVITKTCDLFPPFGNLCCYCTFARPSCDLTSLTYIKLT